VFVVGDTSTSHSSCPGARCFQATPVSAGSNGNARLGHGLSNAAAPNVGCGLSLKFAAPFIATNEERIVVPIRISVP